MFTRLDRSFSLKENGNETSVGKVWKSCWRHRLELKRTTYMECWVKVPVSGPEEGSQGTDTDVRPVNWGSKSSVVNPQSEVDPQSSGPQSSRGFRDTWNPLGKGERPGVIGSDIESDILRLNNNLVPVMVTGEYRCDVQV